MPTTLASGTSYNRVPKINVEFWLIKLMAVTMGETAADYLSVQLGFGLTMTSILMSAVLIIALIWQFWQKRYVPAPYWLAVVLISGRPSSRTSAMVMGWLGTRMPTVFCLLSSILGTSRVAWRMKQ